MGYNANEKKWRGSKSKDKKEVYAKGDTAIQCAKRLNYDCHLKGIPEPNPEIGREKPAGRGRQSKKVTVKKEKPEKRVHVKPEIIDCWKQNCGGRLHPVWNKNNCGDCGAPRYRIKKPK